MFDPTGLQERGERQKLFYKEFYILRLGFNTAPSEDNAYTLPRVSKVLNTIILCPAAALSSGSWDIKISTNLHFNTECKRVQSKPTKSAFFFAIK